MVYLTISLVNLFSSSTTFLINTNLGIAVVLSDLLNAEYLCGSI